jgi:hypothetical protein
MKGPGHKKYQIGRIWECPLCKRRERTSGQVVNLRCNCQATESVDNGVWMRLVEEAPKRKTAEPQSEPTKESVANQPVQP